MKTLRQLFILTNRIIKQNLTSVDTLITSIITPIFMLLFFVYVLGGNILVNGQASTSADYLAYSLPGFLLIAMTMGSAYTALRINTDKLKGFMTRLLTMPMKRWVILGSHVLASVTFMLFSVLAIFVTSLLLGYRPQTTLLNFLLFLILLVTFATMITLVAIPFSLTAKDYASAGAFSYLLIFLLFISPAFIPVAGMATPIRLFAENQPMTPIVETAKSLLSGHFDWLSQTTLLIVGWLLLLIIVFSLLSLKRYKQLFVNI